tara:strand:- start:199 stop:609 length:411 start_codon:yes stop_codon:yes gene_type:complete
MFDMTRQFIKDFVIFTRKVAESLFSPILLLGTVYYFFVYLILAINYSAINGIMVGWVFALISGFMVAFLFTFIFYFIVVTLPVTLLLLLPGNVRPYLVETFQNLIAFVPEIVRFGEVIVVTGLDFFPDWSQIFNTI